MWHSDKLPFENESLVKYLWCIAKYPTLPNQLKGMPKDFKSSSFQALVIILSESSCIIIDFKGRQDY